MKTLARALCLALGIAISSSAVAQVPQLTTVPPLQSGNPPSATPGEGLPMNPPALSIVNDPTALLGLFDGASVLAPGTVNVSVATSGGSVPLSWAVGVAPGVQFNATVRSGDDERRGSTSIGGKVAVLNKTRNGVVGVKLAIAPTVEIVAARRDGTGRATRFGAPATLEIAGAPVRVFSTAGFSGGAWFAGGGITGVLSKRLSASASFSHAWTGNADPAFRLSRNEVSAGLAFHIAQHVSVFGSVGKTVATDNTSGRGFSVNLGFALVHLKETFR